MNKNPFRVAATLAATMIAATTTVTAAHAAEEFQTTSATAGYTTSAKVDPVFGTGTSNEHQTSIRLEHFGIHGYGDNYFFVEDIRGNQIGGPSAGSFNKDTRNMYNLVWNARASFSKISGKKVELGPVSDVSLMYRLERSSYANYSANMLGPSFNLSVPGATWFQTSFLYDKQDHSFADADAKKGHLFWHTFAIFPFQIGSAKFTFSPLLWVNFSKGSTGTETYVEPDLWVKLGELPVDLGFRAQYHRYSNYRRSTPTLLVRLNF